MVLGRKAAVGTAMDKEELEDLLRRLGDKLDELKNATWELDKSVVKAARTVEALNNALGRMEATSRRKLTK